MDAAGDDLLLLMQFPAGEIGRKMALTVSPHVDDNDVTMTLDKFHAREFPVGTGLFEYYSSLITTRWGIITGPPGFKRHNLVNIRFIYMKISDNIADGILSLQIWK